MRWCVPDRALHVSFEFTILLDKMIGEMLTKAVTQAMTPGELKGMYPWRS